MKVIIAGTRDATATEGAEAIRRALVASEWEHEITEVVTGRAAGIDRAGEEWAKATGHWRLSHDNHHPHHPAA